MLIKGAHGPAIKHIEADLDDRPVVEDIIKCIFFNDGICICWSNISVVCTYPFDNAPWLAEIMAWRHS